MIISWILWRRWTVWSWTLVSLVSPTNSDAIPVKKCCKPMLCLRLYLVCSCCPTSRPQEEKARGCARIREPRWWQAGHEPRGKEQDRKSVENIKRSRILESTDAKLVIKAVCYVWYADAFCDKEVRGGKLEVLTLAVCPGDAKSNLSWGHQGVVAEVFKWAFASMFLRMTE